MASEWHTSFCQEEVKDSGFPYIQSFMTLSQNPDLRDSCCMCLSVAPLSPVPLCLSRSDFLATPTRPFISTWSLRKDSEVPFGPGLSPTFKSLKDHKLSSMLQNQFFLHMQLKATSLLKRLPKEKLEVNSFYVPEIHSPLCLRPKPWAN